MQQQQLEGIQEHMDVQAAPFSVKPATVPIRTSARVSKKVKLDLPTVVTQSKAAKKDEETSESKQQNSLGTDPKRPRRRNWGLWSVEDKNIFFEALNEYGKDFDAIQAYFAVKMKKRGLTEAKNKDQVRHFYYRNWHKISKFIKFSVELQKVTQELYALINYGELRKRMGRSVLDKNTVVKLHELIYHGFTLIKVRGKTVRVKTPLCRALRKLNQLDRDNAELPKLPQRVVVELWPLNNSVWSSVHAVAQNPRARTSLPLQHRLSSLLSFLQHRWQHRDRRLLEKFVPPEELGSVDSNKVEVRLRVAPKAGCRISLPMVNVNENLTSVSLSLQTYEERFLGGSAVAGPSKSKGNCTKGSRSKKKAGKEQAEVDVEDKGEEQCNKAILSLQLEGDDATDGDLRSSPLPMEMEEVKPDIKKTEEEPAAMREEQIAKIRNGWSLDEAGTLTLGELYIMFGKDGKLVFEYSWENMKPVAAVENSSVLQKPATDSVANLLQKLVSLAKLLPLIKEKTNCPCGHVCNKMGMKNSNRRGAKASRPNPISAAATSVGTASDPHIVQATAVVMASPLDLPRTLTYQHVTTTAQPLQDGVFRRPLLAPSQFKTIPGATSAEEAFKAQLDQFRPKYCNRRGRSGRKNVVVQRMLPLLPKTANGPSMLTLKVLPQGGEFRPIGPQPSSARVLSFTPVPVVSSPNLIVQQQQPQQQHLVHKQQQLVSVTAASPVTAPTTPPPPSLPLATPPSPPPSISSLLNLGPEELSLGADSTTLLDVPLPSNAPNFVGLLGNDDQTIEDGVPDPCSLLQSSGSTPPISPTRILKETDNQWLNSEVVDFSLSSFLGHLDSPLKSSSTVGPTNDDTRLSQDVEAQLQCLMSESSVDYMAKFADLAAQIASDTAAKK